MLFPIWIQDFNIWVIKYGAIDDDILKLKNQVELNLIILDVSEVHKNLRNMVKSLKNRIIDNYMHLTQQSISG